MLSTDVESGSGSSDHIIATAFGEPSDADFKPPATPQTLPSGITIPSIPVPTT